MCFVLFGLGALSYIMAAFNISSNMGETCSDIANGLMLLTAVLLLFHAANWWRKPKSGD